jgi:molybdate transport system regulatory protein
MQRKSLESFAFSEIYGGSSMLQKIKPAVKVSLVTEGERGLPFCGPGMVRLLEAIKKTGSVREAVELMGISYSKGWKLLSRLEDYLQIPVVDRQQGGKGGGKSALTTEGVLFMEKYTAFIADCNEEVQKVFDKYYGG